MKVSLKLFVFLFRQRKYSLRKATRALPKQVQTANK